MFVNMLSYPVSEETNFFLHFLQEIHILQVKRWQISAKHLAIKEKER